MLLVILAACALWCGSAPGSWAAQPQGQQSLDYVLARMPDANWFPCMGILSRFHSPSDSPITDAPKSGIFGKRHGLAIRLDFNNGPTIGGLFLLRGPSDVSGLVIPTVIDPVDGMACGWPGADISEEGLKTIPPFRAHGYAPATVAGIAIISRVEAATLGLAPDSPLGPESHAVRQMSGPGLFGAKASTTEGAAGAEVPAFHRHGFPAIAEAQPVDGGTGLACGVEGRNEKACEFLACEVKALHGAQFIKGKRQSATKIEAHLTAFPPITIAGHLVTLTAWLDDPEAKVKCPTVTWLWPNGTVSSHTEDCEPDDAVTRHQDIKRGPLPSGDHVFAVLFASAGSEWRASVEVPVQ